MRAINDAPHIGKRFGRWTVEEVGLKVDRRTVWRCVCDCGEKRDIVRENILRGVSSGCRKCAGKAGKSNPAWRGYKDIPMRFYGVLCRSAAARGLRVEVSIEQVQALWERSGGRCALSGFPIEMADTGKRATASIDRIDSSIGYVESNLQFVHKDVNLMKNKFSQERFIEVCKACAECAAA